MKPVVGRFVVAVAAFVLWLGWLTYLVLTASKPTVLSRSQFLVAECTVVVELRQRSDETVEVTVKEVYGPRGNSAAILKGLPAVGETVAIRNLKQTDGWKEPGDYILPLVREGEGYRIAPLPPSPGFNQVRPPFIYPATPETRAQMKTLVAE